MTQSGLVGISPANANDIWAVGSYQNVTAGAPLADHWNGQRWTQFDAPIGPSTLDAGFEAVASLGPSDVWAVGSGHGLGSARTLIEHWDGSRWAVVESPNGSTRTNDLLAIDFATAGDGWAVGDYFDGVKNRALVEHWDGRTWTMVAAESPAAGINRLYGVADLSRADAWAAGSQRESDQTGFQPLIEHWDGRSWSVVSSPMRGQSAELRAIKAIASDDVWAVGDYESGGRFLSLVEHWDGHVWTVQAAPGAFNVEVHALAAMSGTDVWLAGAITQGHGDQWLIQRWDGQSWRTTAPASGSTGAVTAMAMVDGTLWAVGTRRASLCGPDWALIERWTGNSWEVVPSPHDGHGRS